MKKLFASLLVVFLLVQPFMGYCASVTPTTILGNDANPNRYTPPEGCVRLTLPNSDVPGTYTYKLNDNGEFAPDGTNIFTLNVGKAPGNDYTEVLSWSWSGSYTLKAVIVKGGPAFNLYEYNGQTSDTNLVSPTNPSGKPADISHVSIVVCPKNPPVPPTPPDGNIICAIFVVILLAFILIAFLCKQCCSCDDFNKRKC